MPGTGFCFAELTEVFGTGIDVVLKLPKCPVPVIPAVYTGGMPRYVPYRTHPWSTALYIIGGTKQPGLRVGGWSHGAPRMTRVQQQGKARHLQRA